MYVSSSHLSDIGSIFAAQRFLLPYDSRPFCTVRSQNYNSPSEKDLKSVDGVFVCVCPTRLALFSPNNPKKMSLWVDKV